MLNGTDLSVGFCALAFSGKLRLFQLFCSEAWEKKKKKLHSPPQHKQALGAKKRFTDQLLPHLTTQAMRNSRKAETSISSYNLGASFVFWGELAPRTRFVFHVTGSGKARVTPLQGVWDGGRVAFPWFISGFLRVEGIQLPMASTAVPSLVSECSS